MGKMPLFPFLLVVHSKVFVVNDYNFEFESFDFFFFFGRNKHKRQLQQFGFDTLLHSS